MNAPSLSQGTSVRAAPHPAATNATAKPASTACGTEALASADLLTIASTPAITEYGHGHGQRGRQRPARGPVIGARPDHRPACPPQQRARQQHQPERQHPDPARRRGPRPRRGGRPARARPTSAARRLARARDAATAIQPMTASVVIVASPASAAVAAARMPLSVTELDRPRAGRRLAASGLVLAARVGEPDAFGGSRHKTPHLQCRRAGWWRRAGLASNSRPRLCDS